MFNSKNIIIITLMLDTKLQSEEFRFYFLFFLALTFLFSMLMPISYSDFGIWIAEGSQIIRQGTIYITDAYSFNQTTSYPYPWLSCLFYYFVAENLGVDFIFILHRLIPVMIVAFWLTRYPTLLHKKSFIALMICISGLRMLIIDRPALLVLPFIPYFYDLIESGKLLNNKTKSLLLLVLWTNLHGSFSFFFLLLAFTYFIEILNQRRIFFSKEKLLFSLAAFIATLINPWGYKIYTYILETAKISKQRITEWQPLSLYENQQLSLEFLFFAVTLVVLLTVVIKKKKEMEFAKSLMPVFIMSSILAVRNLPLFFTVFPLFWGKHLTENFSLIDYSSKPTFKKMFLHRMLVILLIASGITVFTPAGEKIRPHLSEKYSHQYDETSSFRIAEYLNKTSGKRIFNTWLLGSFLLYSQSNQIFIDSRNIIYNNHVYNDYLKTIQNNDGQAEVLLNQYNIDYVVSEKKAALSLALQTSHNWTFVMDDNGYSLFERK